MSCRPLILSLLLSLACASSSFAGDKEKSEKAEKAPAVSSTESMKLLDLVQTKDYKAVWASIFKGEYSPPLWVLHYDAESTGMTEVTAADGKTFSIGSMCKASDCANDRLLVAFSADHKKGWALEITVPTGLGADGVAHPKKYASLRWYNQPDPATKKVIMSYLEKDPGWK
ncbi:MAG: inhibitor of vertebrate lysozyme family protein [Candidatus Obscuribacterales bacterium]|nr:inhibitor of vertebrate lysozyme family protein [Candidatus Obscuribacterales bacterium]